MIELTFNKPWFEQLSPITIRFVDDEPFTGVTLRFDKPWVDRVSPIVIRFGYTPIDPPVPVDNTIGIECGLVWIPPLEPQSELVLAESATNFEVQQSTDWSILFSDGRLISSDWQSWYSHTIIAAMGWFISGETRSDLSLNWTTPADHIAVTGITWLTPDEHQQTQVLSWLALDAEILNTSVNWWDGVKHHTNVALQYHGDVRDNQCAVKWGIPAARWVCSSKYRPPKSPIKIRFSDPFSANTTPITIRFTASPEVCEWYPGGGLLNPFPDLPDLDFNIPIEPQLRRYYLMQPTITCVRVSDNVPIVISNISISRSRGQWASSVNVDFSSRIDATRAENQLLKIGINGYEFFAYIEQLSCSKVFGSQTYTGTGRSRSAELASPYVLPTSYTNATSLSFAGLLSNILQFTDWTVALNGIVDFNVPAGAFSVGNKSPIEQVQEAVSQLGCMLVCDDENQLLTVVPRWPTSPWMMDGATPDITLHDAVITSYSESKEIGTECNVVWLRGEQQGISAKVKRAGSAGNIATDDISAQLIVDNQAARTAGTNALADTGNKLNINMSLPIMADLPPLTPGMLVGVREGVEVFKGTCDSVSISASVSNTGDIDIEQSITVVRHVA
ncbi:hypothetical protein [Shewanella holmiensis]|uniref:Uncharacterized protein n=1 Tax=Shewanella holmiensis TaxID=2952222 RepID=A0A9X3APV8_9GAMM|nr:hypothetical protein [Shewanella holmiensis]MCT7942376.1 hypothetical protein [Shewanella holmiensis]